MPGADLLVVSVDCISRHHQSTRSGLPASGRNLIVKEPATQFRMAASVLLMGLEYASHTYASSAYFNLDGCLWANVAQRIEFV